MIAPTDGLAVGLAVGWVLYLPWLLAPGYVDRWRGRPVVGGAAVAIVSTAMNTAGYLTRSDVHGAWARALAEGICAGAVVGLTMDLRGRLERAPGGGPALRGRLGTVALATSVAVLVGALHALSAGLQEGAATGLGIGLVVLYLRLLRLHPRVLTAHDLVSPVEVGVFVLVVVGLVAGFGYGLMLGLVAGLGSRVARDLAGPRHPSGEIRRSIRHGAAGVLLGGVVALGADGDHIPGGGLLLILATSALAGALAFGQDAENLDESSFVTPHELYRRDRAAAISIMIAVPSAVGVAVGARALATTDSAWAASLAAVGTVVTYGLTAALVIAVTVSRYPAFTATQVTLCLRGKTPWGLMAFLNDAHRERHVLRSAGTAYQFDHELLRAALAAEYGGSAASEPSNTPVFDLTAHDRPSVSPDPSGRT
jgi:hypothetical protein